MTIRGRITYVGAPDATARELPRAAKEGMTVAAKWWHRTVMPRHFQRSARRRYGYKPRTEKYVKQKIRKYGRGTDLILTGLLKQRVLRSHTIRGTSKRISVIMNGPSYLHMYPKGSRPSVDTAKNDKGERPLRPLGQIAKELTAVTQDELETLARLVDRVATKRLQRNRTRRVVNV